MGELEETVAYLRTAVQTHRKTIFWSVCALLFFLLVAQVKEVASLLLASYGLALLLDPVVTRFEERGVSRTVAILGIGGVLFAFGLLLLVLLVPAVVGEYQQLIVNLPDYVRSAAEKSSVFAERWLGVEPPESLDQVADEARQYVAAIGVEQLKAAGAALGKTALQGYSLALTVFNLLLLPFFVFYLTRDLRAFHRTLGSFLDTETQTRISTIGKEILTHVYAFFKGQLTVSIILAVLYIIGFALADLPWAFAVGTLTGLLNIVPYLGVAIGFLLATLLTLVSEPSLSHFAFVYGVFIAVQIVEGNFLTPKIVGESVGIHPLGVMVALIIGGDLFGLLGMILAIPAAAAIRVLFNHSLAAVESSDEADELVATSGL
ncbi:MAG: AI-2E family transporter [Bdellovibrionales bacterium]|nr:AI-2E family transporter [Bdellovibrionales bacterium]